MDTLERSAGRAIFGKGAADYHAVRSDYPEELFDDLRARVGARPRMLEIGPGSGLATQGLLTLDPARLVAVESDPDFAGFLRERFAAAPIDVVNQPFPCEHLVGPFDLAVCAAAFHWLDPEPALAAIRRLLKPGGVWAMWWNSYLNEQRDDPFAAAAMDWLRRFPVALPPSFGAEGHTSLDVAAQTAMLARAGFDDITHRLWQRRLWRDAAEARKLFASFSFVRHLPEPDQVHLLDGIVALVEEQFGGRAPGLVVTSCYVARSGSPAA